MSTTNSICALCDQPAISNPTDHSNRQHIVCTSDACGDYEISIGALKSIQGNAMRKEELRLKVVELNAIGSLPISLSIRPICSMWMRSTSGKDKFMDPGHSHFD